MGNRYTQTDGQAGTHMLSFAFALREAACAVASKAVEGRAEARLKAVARIFVGRMIPPI